MKEVTIFSAFAVVLKSKQDLRRLSILSIFEQISQLCLFLLLNAKLKLTEASIINLSFHCNHSFNPAEQRPWRRGLLPFSSHSHTI